MTTPLDDLLTGIRKRTGTNEAAERLRHLMHHDSDEVRQLLDEALAAERRATVERLRKRWWKGDEIATILDEEAAR